MAVCPHPYDMPHWGEDTCKTGIRKDGECPANWQYPVPSAGTSAFYTTWSFFYCMIAVGILALYLILTLVGKGKRQQKFQTKVLENKVFQLIMISLIAMGALNSIGVLSTSQLLIAKNFGLVDLKTNKPLLPNEMEEASLTTTFFHNVMNINLDSHIMPGILGMIMLLCLGLTRQSPRPWRWNLGLACLILILNIVLVGIWMAVPVKDKDGKVYQGIAKLKYVYSNPPGWFFAVQIAMIVVLAFIVAFRIA